MIAIRDYKHGVLRIAQATLRATLAEVATEHNSTLVLPIPIDVLEAVRHHAESADEVDGQPASSRR